MKTVNFLALAVLTFVLANCGQSYPDPAPKTDPPAGTSGYYQLKAYIFDTVSQENAIDKYLKEAFLPGAKKFGVSQIGVFKQRENNQDSVKKIFVLIPFTSFQQYLTFQDKLDQDAQYLEAGKDYIDASYKNPPYRRIESTLLKALEGKPLLQAPSFTSPRTERVYELRSYESATEKYFHNKVDMFLGGGETKIFDRLGSNPVFYGEVISGAKMPNLMYMTTYSDQASRDAHWKAFDESPEWKALLAMPKYDNNISHIDFNFLFPTEYSDY